MVIEDHYIETENGEKLPTKKYFYSYKINVDDVEYASVYDTEVEYFILKSHGYQQKPTVVAIIPTNNCEKMNSQTRYIFEQFFDVCKAELSGIHYAVDNPVEHESYLLTDDEYKQLKF